MDSAQRNRVLLLYGEPVVDLKGAERDSFIFMQFSAKNSKIIGWHTPRELVPPGISWIRHWEHSFTQSIITHVRKIWTNKSRVHSSRICTVRCSGRLGGCLPGFIWSTLGEVCLPRGCLPRGVCQGVCYTPPVDPEADPTPCRQDSWHTLVKTLPFYNYCCRQ